MNDEGTPTLTLSAESLTAFLRILATSKFQILSKTDSYVQAECKIKENKSVEPPNKESTKFEPPIHENTNVEPAQRKRGRPSKQYAAAKKEPVDKRPKLEELAPKESDFCNAECVQNLKSARLREKAAKEGGLKRMQEEWTEDSFEEIIATDEGSPNLIRAEVQVETNVCELCPKKPEFVSIQDLRLHSKTAHPTSFLCDICGIALNDQTAFFDHLKIHYSAREKPKRPRGRPRKNPLVPEVPESSEPKIAPVQETSSPSSDSGVSSCDHEVIDVEEVNKIQETVVVLDPRDVVVTDVTDVTVSQPCIEENAPVALIPFDVNMFLSGFNENQLENNPIQQVFEFDENVEEATAAANQYVVLDGFNDNQRQELTPVAHVEPGEQANLVTDEYVDVKNIYGVPVPVMTPQTEPFNFDSITTHDQLFEFMSYF